MHDSAQVPFCQLHGAEQIRAALAVKGVNGGWRPLTLTRQQTPTGCSTRCCAANGVPCQRPETSRSFRLA